MKTYNGNIRGKVLTITNRYLMVTGILIGFVVLLLCVGCSDTSQELSDEWISLNIKKLDHLIGASYEDVKATYDGRIISLEQTSCPEYELEQKLEHDGISYTTVLMFDSVDGRPNRVMGISLHGKSGQLEPFEAIESKDRVLSEIERSTHKVTTYEGLSNKLSKFDNSCIIEGSWVETYSVSTRANYEVCLYVISNRSDSYSDRFSMSYLLFYEPVSNM